MRVLKKANIGYLLLTIAALIWGIDNTVVKIGLREIPPITFSFIRFPIAGTLFALTLLFSKLPRTIEKKDLPRAAFLGFSNSVLGVVFINLGLKYTTASNASIIISIFPPIFIAILAWYFLKERLSLTNILGIPIAALGVGFLMNIFSGLKELVKSQYFLGNIFTIVAALSWAIYNVWGKPLFKKYNPITFTAYIFFFGTLFLIPPFLWELSSNKFRLSLVSILSILFDSVGAGFFSYLCWNKGLKTIAASKAGVFTYVIALSGVAAAIIFLREQLSIHFIIGTVLTCLGVYLATKPKLAKVKEEV